MLIKYKEERDAGGELSAVAASAELLFKLGLVDYDAHGDVVDGFRMREARKALTTQRAVGASVRRPGRCFARFPPGNAKKS